MVYDIGIGVPVDSPRALKLYRDLCDGGDKNACAELGWFLTDPGPQLDAPAGLALLAKTCDGGGARACDLAALQETNDGSDTPKGLELAARAAKLYRQDCEAGVYNACAEVKVKGPDAKAALALLESRCKQGVAAACGNLGSLYVFGVTDSSGASLVPQSGEKAEELLEGACKRVARGCRFLAEIYDFRKDPREDTIRGIACDAWDATSCWKLGKHERACDLGHAGACTKVSRQVRL